MEIKNRIVAVIFRVLLLVGCGIGLYFNSGLPNGALSPAMFNYYTIQSNLIVFVFFIYMLIDTFVKIKSTGVKGVLDAPRFKGAVTMMITVTFLVYHFMLLPMMFSMSGGEGVINPANILVHYFTPIMVIIDWLLFDKKNRYKWYDPLIWLIIPLAYFGFAVIRAEVSSMLLPTGSRYPYFFIDIDELGLSAVLINVAVLIMAFAVLGYIIYFIGKIHVAHKKLYFGSKSVFR